MGNSHPSEYNGVNCIQCSRRLPPCKDFDDFHKERIDRLVRVDMCYVYNGGQYYRVVGGHGYYCPEDFWQPKEDYLEQQEEKRREERERQRREQEERKREQARLREIARQQELEQIRLEEQQRLEEEKRHQREAKEEADRQKAVEEKTSKKLEELTREKQQQVSAKFLQLSLSNNAHEEVHAQTEIYKPYVATETSRQELHEVEMSSYNANLPDDVVFLENEAEEEITLVTKELAESVQYSIDVMTTGLDDESNTWWLKASQTLLLTYYMQLNSFSENETDLLLSFLAFLQRDLDGKESLTLAETFSSLVQVRPSDFSSLFQLNESLSLTAKMSTLLLQNSKFVKKNSLWMQRCLYTLAIDVTTDERLQRSYLGVTCKNWSGFNWLEFFEQCQESSLSEDMQMHILHLIQTYCVQPGVMMSGVLKQEHHSIIGAIKQEIESEQNKLLVDIIDEIQETELVDEELLSHVEKIAKRVNELLSKININLNFDKHFQSTVNKSVSTLKKLADSNSSVTDEEIAESMTTLMCACKKVKPFYPRRTQMVSVLLLLLSSQRRCNRLLEVMTGEGKSLIVVLFATILGIQGKHVDIVSSSPVLALRDAEEYAGYYELFDLSVTHNTDLDRPEDCNMDEIKKQVYKRNVVYGTVGDFAGDILREEFEQKQVRSRRRFDAVIVDEVDMLMLDEGVQFTYLSHNAAMLYHVEPVIAAVWGLIGPLRLASTNIGNILYTGSPKLFTEAVFETLDPEVSHVHTHSQVLATILELGIITQDQFERLLSDDQEVKRLEVAKLTKADAFALINGLEDYENMPEFLVYTINDEGLLESATVVTNEESAEKLLFLENGLACILNTKEEIIERGSEILRSKLCFSDEEKKANIKLPGFMKEFVLHQIPQYVESAIRALHMEEDREYTITNGRIIPVDFQNSGVMELNKKWGGGLQQMLELKHNLSLTGMSLVTNFMSNVEFFSRYKRSGGIYGMSGTLGLDSHSSTTVLLQELYNTKVCSIPSFRVRKLFEKPAIIVENDKQWFQQIYDTVVEETSVKASWKEGRAVLILCEDIKTAENLRDFMDEKGWQKEKVHLYAHSNSKQLSSIKKKLGPKDLIIATNLAGRGTNIKVINEVNESGGLLCLVTFLARNRRVELQAFGRTARSGKTGSCQCILSYSSLPSQYDGLDIQDMRKLRADEEHLRLRRLINNDVKEVQLREVLFKSYCQFLQELHHRLQGRDDKRVVRSSLNEKWSQWLQMKNEQIEQLREQQLLDELKQATTRWVVKIPTNHFEPVDLPVANFYHFVQFGNQLLIKEDDEEIKRACKYFTKSIEFEPRYAAIALYNRAYCYITAEVDDYKQRALADIQAAIDCLTPYVSEISEVYQCAALVSQVRDFKERETDDFSEDKAEKVGDFNAQIHARFEILSFLKQKMEEAVRKINEIDGDVIAKPVGIFSLIPNADYCTSMELTRMWTLGIEIVYSIEKKPRFCWEGLVVFLLGIVQIVGGVLLTVFTVGAAAQFGMGLIAEGISDCISGIEGMVTGEFSWTEWAIAKATGLALSLISGGVSRLASTGFKAIKAGYKIAKFGRQLKAIPKIIRSTTASVAKKNLKTAAKYVAKEAVLQGVSYAQSKFMSMAVGEIAELIGDKLKESFIVTIQANFLTGYLGEVVNERYIKELNVIDRARGEVGKSMTKRAKWFFTKVGELVVTELDNNPEVKQRLSTSSLTLFEEVSEKSDKLRGLANFAKAAITGYIVADAVVHLVILVEEFALKMEEVCRTFNERERVVMSSHTDEKYSYACARKLKTDLADHAGEIFANAVASLLQGRLGPLINQYQMTNKVGQLHRTVLGKYVLKTDKTMEHLEGMQHANYIRSVGADFKGDGPPSNVTVAKTYAKRMQSADSPGSLMEIRVAAAHYGQKVTIYRENKGKLVKESSIIPDVKKSQDEIQLVYIPASNPDSVGHYDVIVRGTRKRVDSDDSNCLFHAYAFGRNPDLSTDQLKQEAKMLRKTVATTIMANPHRYAEHIKLRVEMDNLRRGNRFAMVGAGPLNPHTKVLPSFYHQAAKGNQVYTMYLQANGVKCKAVRNYDKNITVVNGVVQETDARLQSFVVHMDGLSLDANRGMRCQHTKPVVGQIKRFKGKPTDTEVSYHLIPSRAGANAGDQYANAVPTSPFYNNLEKNIWTKEMENCIGTQEFSMTVNGSCSPITGEYRGRRDIDDATKKLLKERYELIETKEPRAYRMTDPTYFDVHLPSSATKPQMDAIIAATHDKDTIVGADILPGTTTVRFYMPTDWDLFTPNDVDGLQSNGELHAGELTNSTSKQKRLTVGKSPYYRSPPKSSKSPKNIQDFEDEFKDWIP